MVRGILTQHVMEAVSKEMFGGEQGRRWSSRRCRRSSRRRMPADQKRALVDMLGSVQKFYNGRRPTRHGGAARRGHHDAVHREGRSDDRGLEHRLQRLRAFVRRHGDPVPAVRDGERRHRDAARAPARAVERLRSAPVSRLTLLAGKAASGALISLMILLVSFALRDDRLPRPHPGQHRSASSASRSPAR